MAGLFDGVVTEDPLFSQSAEQFARQAKQARDEAVVAHQLSADSAREAKESAEVAKVNAEKVLGQVDTMQQLHDRVLEAERSVSGNKGFVEDSLEKIEDIKDYVTTEKENISDLVDGVKDFSDKFDADKVELEGMIEEVTVKHADVVVKHDETSQYRGEAEAHKNAAKESADKATWMAEGAEESANIATAMREEVANDRRIVAQQVSYVNSVVDEARNLSNKFEGDKAAVSEMVKTVTEKQQDVTNKHQDVVSMKNTTEGFMNQASTHAKAAEASKIAAKTSEDKAKVSENAAASSAESVKGAMDQAITVLAETKAVQDRVENFQGEVITARDVAVAAKSEALSAKDGAIAARDSAIDYEAGAKNWHDLTKEMYQDVKHGQAYGGLWNPNSGKYPIAVGNSTWDVVLNDGQQFVGVDFNGATWFFGDKLVYVLEHDKFYRLPSGSTVTSVNGYRGAVTLNAGDVGALSLSGGKVSGDIEADRFFVYGNSALHFNGDSDYTWRTGSEPSNGTYVLNRYKNHSWQDTPFSVEGWSGAVNIGTKLTVNHQEVYHPGNKPTAADVGAATVSDLANKSTLKIEDIRTLPNTPAQAPSTAMQAWFSMDRTPTGNWCSGLTMKGWATGYNTWQLASDSAAGTPDNKLYFRTGAVDEWEDWQEIYSSSNPPSKVKYTDKVTSDYMPLLWTDVDGNLGANTSAIIIPSTGDIRTNGYIRAQGGFYDQGQQVYSPMNKPTPAEIGAIGNSNVNTLALNTELGWMDGNNQKSRIWSANGGLFLSGGASNSGSGPGVLRIHPDELSFAGNKIYHEGYKPTVEDFDALSIYGGTFKGTLVADFVKGQFRSQRYAAGLLGDLLGQNESEWSYVVNTIGSADCFPSVNNANGVLTFNTHAGKYGHQLAMSSNGNMYQRSVGNGSWSEWNKVYTSGAKPTAKDVGAVSADGTTVMTGELMIAGADKQFRAGSLGWGTYVANTKTGMYLYLHDNGELVYNTHHVYHQGFKPTASEVGAPTLAAFEALSEKVESSLGGVSNVTSVNGKTGNVYLNATDVGAIGTTGNQSMAGRLTVNNNAVVTGFIQADKFLAASAQSAESNSLTQKGYVDAQVKAVSDKVDAVTNNTTIVVSDGLIQFMV